MRFTLYDLDPDFWARVKAKAEKEGTTVKTVILKLLATWLGVFLLALTVTACGGASNSVTGPTPAPTPAPAPVPPPTPFQGVWIGTWTKSQCTETGGAVGVGCPAVPTGGGLNITLTQGGSIAQGTVTIGSYQLAVSGPISSSNQLTLTGQGKQSGATVNISSWGTSISGNLMLGSFIYIVAPDDVRLGSVTVTAGLQSVVKQ